MDLDQTQRAALLLKLALKDELGNLSEQEVEMLSRTPLEQWTSELKEKLKDYLPVGR